MFLCRRKCLESSKIYDQRKMNKKLKVTLKVLDNVASTYGDTKNYIEENMKEKA